MTETKQPKPPRARKRAETGKADTKLIQRDTTVQQAPHDATAEAHVDFQEGFDIDTPDARHQLVAHHKRNSARWTTVELWLAVVTTYALIISVVAVVMFVR